MSYSIKNNWDGLASSLSKIWDLSVPKTAMVITDENIAPLYLADVHTVLANSTIWHIQHCIIPSGETAKNFNTYTNVLQAMYNAGLDRSSVVVALGGGIVSDVAGFAAATFMRGIDYINIPTTLLAMTDSAIGGKTGIDFLGEKNLIGAFHQPRLIYSNIAVLSSLPKNDYISGLAEVIKYGIIKDVALLEFLNENISKVLICDEATLLHIIKSSCDIKTEIVTQDEKDNDLRQILNFGHTFGHAIETLMDFKLPHGHCVSIGMVCALRYSVAKLNLPQDDADFVIDIIRKYGLPISSNLSPQQIYQQMKRDKKAQSGKLTIIATSKLGTAQIVKNPDEKGVIQCI
ncbi:MAG: 3-dehydroquinate synthase [Defluviitaleaceae bacterium]|nr:3-dehydroquinate synthase [Defluviitaleaceae bacterium]